MADRTRQTNRFNFRGLNTRSLPDAILPGKSPLAIDIRAQGDTIIRTRPGYTKQFATGGLPATDLRSITTLGTDNKPRTIVHDSGGGVWLDDGIKKGTVGTGGLGASMIAYRPNQSPQSWMYVCNATGYKKFSAPDGSNNVTAQKVGIAEPQSPPDACPDGLAYNEFTLTSGSWAQGGTAAGPSGSKRSTDTVVAIFQDPASVSPATRIRYSVQLGTEVYQAGETLTFNKSTGGTVKSVVEDVYPPINGGTALTIQSILYLFGPAGRCVIVPSQMQNYDSTQLPVLPDQLSGLRRGCLVQIGAEVVFVLSVTVGTQGQIAFECSPQFTHLAGEAIVGIPAIAVAGITSVVVGQTVSAAQINSAITTGVGTLTQTLGTNPFNLALGSIGTPQDNDHIHLSLSVSVPTSLTEFKLLFDIGDGSFTQNFLYYSVTPSVIQAAIANTQTQLSAVQQQAQQDLIRGLTNQFESQGYAPDIAQNLANAAASTGLTPDVLASLGLPSSPNQLGFDPTLPGVPGIASTGVSQFTELIIAITDLTRVGNDQSKTLANCNAVQVLVNCSADLTAGFGSLWVGGGGQPDLGDTISGNPSSSTAPLLYRVRPRSALTGARGNPSPAMRYGVNPHRQKVVISLPSAAYDSQIDTWDIERYGGTVLADPSNPSFVPWRLVGSASSSASTFVDNIFDDAARSGEALEFDNFEPWPSVDVPWTATVGSGGISSITVYGTAIKVLGSTFPSTILNWLPGTLIVLNGQVAVTLWNRPVGVSGGYLFRTIENVGNPTITTLVVNEPNVANQSLPYAWGPDANGIVFAAGDPLRPGVLYSAKQFAPDMTPNNVYDLVPPSEPILGGDIIDGLSIGATSKRWFQFQAAFGTPQRWLPIEMPAGRGLAAPFAHCTDGKFEYFVAKDGVYSMIPGLPAISLTEVDIGNLFPNVDGLGGTNVVYAGYTFYAPDYSRAAQFRLSITNSMLRFHYRDSTGTPRTMVCDMSLDSEGKPRMAWSSDQYHDLIIASYQPDQPSGTVLTAGTSYSQVYLADASGFVYTESDLTNDNGSVINPAFATPEWDAGDARIQKRWLDAWIDCIPAAPAGVIVSPAQKGILTGTQTTIPTSTSRTLPPTILAIGNPVASFLGLIFQWMDDFTKQAIPTQLYEYSEEFVAQPLLIKSWQSVPTSHGLQGYHHIRKIVFAYLTTGANPVTLTISAYDGTSPTALSLPGTSGVYQKVEFVPTFNKGLLFTYQGSCADQWAPVLPDCEVHVGAWARSGPYAVFTDLGGAESA